MPEPFKNVFNTALINNMANHFAKHAPTFNRSLFIKLADHQLTTLELKARSNQIMQAMQQTLPNNLSQSSTIILKSLAPIQHDNDDVLFSQHTENNKLLGIQGWAIMPVADYIGIQALNNIAALNETTHENNVLTIIETAMHLFKALTQRFSAEFGIRFLLNHYPKQSLAILEKWTNDPSRHVRRLVSEGTRPRLPWGMQLPLFIKQPTLIFPLLTALKNDNEEYVRRSVANNLNDIAKDHPNLVANIAEKWLAESVRTNKQEQKNLQRLVRHACRTLLKNGHIKTLTVFGYLPPELSNIVFNVSPKNILLGDEIALNLSISSASQQTQSLMIDFAIHHQKANGTTSAKVFKWANKTLTAGQSLQLTKRQLIKKITTRKYYSGIHQVDIIINGNVIATQRFHLQITD